MKNIINFTALFLCSLNIYAQSTIKGTLLNEYKQPVPSANVILLSLPDSTLVKGAISNDKGVFEFLNASNSNKLVVKITHLEYKDKILPTHSSDLGTILLEQSFNELGEVVVSATKPIMKQQGTKITTDIATSSLNKVPKVDMLLNFLPGVSTSYTGAGFEVFGKGNALFYINNKRVRDMNDVYRIQPQEIDKIEMETQPGAEHDNSVGAIIRIILKKRQGDGLSGNINTEAEFKKGQTAFADVNLNYRTGKTDIFFSAKPSANFTTRSEHTRDLAVHTLTNNWQVLTSEKVKDNTKGIYAKTGLNHEFNENHSAGVSVWTNISPISGRSFTEQETQTFKNGNLLEKGLNTYDRFNQDKRLSANAYYDGKLSDNINLQSDIFYTGAFSDHNSDILEQNITALSQRNIKTHSEAKSGLWATKTSLSQKLGKGLLNYGIEASSLSRSDNYNDNLGVKSEIDNKELQSAGFASYSFNWKKTNIKAGLRYEYTNFEYFENNIKNNIKSRSYNNWLPNISIAFPWNKIQWAVSYIKKISRPAFYQLSDRSTYDTPFLLNRGNPYISPRLSDDFSVLTSYKNYSVSLNYSFVHNGFYEDFSLSSTNPNMVERTTRNFGDFQNLKLVFSAMHQIAFWASKLDLTLGKQFGKDVFYTNKPIFGVELMNQFMLSENMTGFLLLNYRSKGSMATQYLHEPMGMVSLIVARSFLNKKLDVYAGVMDAFGTMNQNATIQNAFITNKSFFDNNIRSFRIGFDYKFNPAQSKYKGRTNDKDDRL